MSLQEFRSKILKVKEKRNHKISNSLGVYDAYKYIRKNKWLNIGQSVTEKQFYYIVRTVNKYLVESLLEGRDILFPNRMGRLEIMKYKVSYTFKDGKLKTNLPIDWDRTLKLWYEDKESHKDKVLLKQEEKEIFKIFYNKSKAVFNNKSLYDFKANRELKSKIKETAKAGELYCF